MVANQYRILVASKHQEIYKDGTAKFDASNLSSCNAVEGDQNKELREKASFM